MNKNKACPRCKQPTLIKNDKNNSFLCSTCKYMSKTMHIVTQAQNQYGAQHKFWLKIKDKKQDQNHRKSVSTDILSKIEQSEKRVAQLCIKQFQRILRQSLQRLFIKSDNSLLNKKSQIMLQAKQIWGAYLDLIAKDKSEPYGIFTKCISKWRQKVVNKNSRNLGKNTENQILELTFINQQGGKGKQDISTEKPKRKRKNKQQQKPQLSERGYRQLLVMLEKFLENQDEDRSISHTKSKKEKSNSKSKSKNKNTKQQRKKKGYSIQEVILKKQESLVKILNWTIEAFSRSVVGPEKQYLLVKIALRYAQHLYQIDELRKMQRNSKLSLNYFMKKQSYFSAKHIDQLLQKKNILNLKANNTGQDLTFSSEEDIKSYAQRQQIKWKRQFKLVMLFLQGLLKYILRQKIENIMKLNFEELMGFYYLLKSSIKQGLQLIEMLLKMLIKYLDQSQKKEVPKIPKLSYSLIYAVGFLVLLINQTPITLNQVISRIGYLEVNKQTSLETFLQEKVQFIYVEHKQIITTEKIRKTTTKLFNYLYSNGKITIPAVNISKWIQFYCINRNLIELKQKATELYRVFMQHDEIYRPYHKKLIIKEKQHKHTYLDHRHIFLEQDIHALIIIFIVIKIYYGFGVDQHLINMDYNLLEATFSVKKQQEKQIYTNTLQKIRNVPQLLPSYMHQKLKIHQIITRLYKINSQQPQRILSLRQYTDTQSMTWKTYQKVFHVSQKQINLVKSSETKKKPKKNGFITLDVAYCQKQPITLSRQISKQIEVIYKECIEKNVSAIPSYLLQHPAQNYEVYHDYQSVSQCLNRDKMIYVLEQLIGNSFETQKTFQILDWYERVLVLYQRKNR